MITTCKLFTFLSLCPQYHCKVDIAEISCNSLRLRLFVVRETSKRDKVHKGGKEPLLSSVHESMPYFASPGHPNPILTPQKSQDSPSVVARGQCYSDSILTPTKFGTSAPTSGDDFGSGAWSTRTKHRESGVYVCVSSFCPFLSQSLDKESLFRAVENEVWDTGDTIGLIVFMFIFQMKCFILVCCRICVIIGCSVLMHLLRSCNSVIIM